MHTARRTFLRSFLLVQEALTSQFNRIFDQSRCGPTEFSTEIRLNSIEFCGNSIENSIVRVPKRKLKIAGFQLNFRGKKLPAVTSSLALAR